MAEPQPAAMAADAPQGWTPPDLRAVPARRSPGLVAGTIDALRGVAEHGDGQPLSQVQVERLAPFLAERYALPPGQVEQDLRDVRLYVGGPAAGREGWAFQVDHSIYVPGERELGRIMDWSRRRWLAHELGHVMQWRRAAPDGADLDRTRRSSAHYALGMAVDGRRPGAVPVGVANWLRARLDGEQSALFDEIHDAHPMEREAEHVAQQYAAQGL